MPRSFGSLFPRLVSFDNLLAAFSRARRGKRHKPAVGAFEAALEVELLRLQDELASGAYRPGPYRSFYVHQQKRRLITAAPFRDRVVHHALLRVLEPVFEPAFIRDSYACRVGRGQHQSLDRYQAWSRRYRYVLRGDVAKFYPSVDHRILLGLVRRRVRDARLLELVAMIVESGAGILDSEWPVSWFEGDTLFSPLERKRGLPIGSLTSQFFGNVYLNELDHYVKERLRCRAHLRYMDDFAVFGDDPAELAAHQRSISEFLARLRLTLHRARTRVWRTSDGAEFLGFRVFPEHRLPRKATVYRYSRHLRRLAERKGPAALQRIRDSFAAWHGHTQHGKWYQVNRLVLEHAELLAGQDESSS
jgi:RNA-directed DNA polymerase